MGSQAWGPSCHCSSNLTLETACLESWLGLLLLARAPACWSDKDGGECYQLHGQAEERKQLQQRLRAVSAGRRPHSHLWSLQTLPDLAGHMANTWRMDASHRLQDNNSPYPQAPGEGRFSLEHCFSLCRGKESRSVLSEA